MFLTVNTAPVYVYTGTRPLDPARPERVPRLPGATFHRRHVIRTRP